MDDQLGYLSNYIFELEDSTSQVDMEESLEPEEVDGELFYKACAVQSRAEESTDNIDILEGHENRAATLRKSSQPMISSNDKKYKKYTFLEKRRGQVRFLTFPHGDKVDGTEVRHNYRESSTRKC